MMQRDMQSVSFLPQFESLQISESMVASKGLKHLQSFSHAAPYPLPCIDTDRRWL